MIINIRKKLKNMSVAIDRFPMASLFSFFTFILFVLTIGNYGEFRALALIGLMGSFSSIAIEIYTEDKEKKKKVFLALLNIVFLGVFYKSFLYKGDNINISAYLGTFLPIFLSIYFVSKKNRDEDYSEYVLNINNSFLITILYSGVLIAGVFIILATVRALFQIYIHENVYMYTLNFATFIFGASLFLSNFPDPSKSYGIEESLREKLYSFVVIPLILIYTVILYIYLGKVLLTRIWPEGIISNLVLWYLALSIWVIIATKPISNRLVLSFKKIMPILSMPLLLMAGFAIYIRVNQYGFTENRYYIMLLNLWVFGVMLSLIINKEKNYRFIPISLAIISLIAIYGGPLSSYGLSKYSQNARLKDVLVREKLLVNDQVNLDKLPKAESQNEIVEVINYFKKNDRFEDIKYFGQLDELVVENYLSDFEDISTGNLNDYYNYYRDLNRKFYDISPYKTIYFIDGWSEEEILGDKEIVNYKKDDKTLIIREGESTTEVDLEDLLKDRLVNNFKAGLDEDIDLVIETISGRKIHIIVRSLSAIIKADGSIDLTSIEFILLI